MTETCTTETKSCGCQKGYRCSLVAMAGSGFFLFLSVNTLMQIVNAQGRQGLPWRKDQPIDVVTASVMALFALAVLVDAVRSFRRGSLGRLAFFGVLMTWTVAVSMVLFYAALEIVPKLAL